MALRNQPYIPLYVQDFLTDEKLMECSAKATGVYIRLICLMHKSQDYGTFLLKQKDKQNESNITNFAYKLAKFLPYRLDVIESSLEELIHEKVIEIEGDLLFQKRMVKDGILSDKRSLAGSKGGKKTLGKQPDFAQAKFQANSENESEYVIENENVVKNVIESGVRVKKPKIDFQEIINIYNSVCVELPKVTKIIESRKKAITKILENNTLEELGQVFINISESDYLNGKIVSWRADFDWVMKPDNFVKILENNYKNKNNGKSGTKSNSEIFTDAATSEIGQSFRFK